MALTLLSFSRKRRPANPFRIEDMYILSNRDLVRALTLKRNILRPLCVLALLAFLLLVIQGGTGPAISAEGNQLVSDHFNGSVFFNPQDIPGEGPQRSALLVLRFIFGINWSTWPEPTGSFQAGTPVLRSSKGKIIVTAIGHGTFLIQMDGLNILTDPIWSDRCSPVSWAGPKRYRAPGIRFEDLPPIDAVLVSHNHYDHLDVPTLKRLAEKGAPCAITPLGNRDLILETGIPEVDELDWWQSFRLSKGVTVTMVPAQHFSSRRPWDRNKTLWAGFVISGPSGNVYYAGDTGYGPHFREIAKRFPRIDVSLLPIAPFRPKNTDPDWQRHVSRVHMGPAEAVQAHLDLGSRTSVAAHFQVFRLGPDGFDDALSALKSAIKERNLAENAFIAPTPGQRVDYANLQSDFGPVALSAAGGSRW